jgi:PAS domain S-box-containing protein
VRKLEDRMLALERSYRELAESERRYHELFDVATDVIFTLDPDANFSLVNRRVREILGYHMTELLGRPFEPLVTASHRARARESVQQALNGQRRTLELDFLRADGRVLPMHVVTVPLWQGQRPTGLMGIARDLGVRAGAAGPPLQDWARALREIAAESPEGTPARHRLLDLADAMAGPVSEG